MARYLLAAEADKIQDLIFRSARLLEVVGGSQLLTRFCRKVPGLLGAPLGDIIVNDGGSFRILFDTKEAARNFGEQLAEVYRLVTGGTLTIAEPVEVKEPIDKHFHAAQEKANEALREAKRWQEVWRTSEHLPYIAFCSSCGVGLAGAHTTYYEGEEPQYLCSSCLNKSAERAGQKTTDSDSFLCKFYRIVMENGEYDWPGNKKRHGRREKDPLEDIADYDPRRYVAYLLADGNKMGEVFGACRTPDQMRRLSHGLSQAIRKALAKPTLLLKNNLMKHNPREDSSNFIPVLPLILGGDDLFALIPAPWALDFARCFAQAYEEEMKALFKQIELHDPPRPTIATAVVICKAKHPYRLAHEIGEIRLKEAKQMAKQLVLDGGQPQSATNFEVVLGGQLASGLSEKKTHRTEYQIRRTLRPYWVTGQIPEKWGLSVEKLIEQRWALREIPNKRLAELRDLYDDLPSSLNSDEFSDWHTRLNRLLVRLGKLSHPDRKNPRHTLETALSELGGNASAYWRQVDRYPEDSWYGHGLPDLLETWDFALKLEEPRHKYEGED